MHDKFKKNGYIHIKNFHNNKYINKFKLSLKKLCIYNQTNLISLKKNTNFNEKEINNFLIQLKKNHQVLSRKFIQLLNTYQHLFKFLKMKK